MIKSAKTFFRNISIRNKLIALIFLIILITTITGFTVVIFINIDSLREELYSESKMLAQVMGEYCAGAMMFDDKSGAEEIIRKINNVQFISCAALFDKDNKLFAFYSKNSGKSSIPPDFEGMCKKYFRKNLISEIRDRLIVSNVIMQDNTPTGTMILEVSTGILKQKIKKNIYALLAVLAILLTIALFITVKLQKVISNPILNLSSVMKRVEETQDYTIKVSDTRKDEIGVMYDCFNKMLSRIHQHELESNRITDEINQMNAELELRVLERTEMIERANKELNATVEAMKKMQSQLILSEKMAALGNLVGGIAHEINTPLGIGVTGASHLESRVKNVAGQLKNNTLKKSELEQFLNTCQESCSIILSNLSRASELIQSFKQVAVDQSSEEKRKFNLKNYIDDIILSLKPKLRKTNFSIEVNCPDDIDVYSYPGAVSQILTNLVMNSLLHGFENRDDGKMSITVEIENNNIIMRYYDNGNGIKSENLNRIFDPFYTTKRGKGGTGLGLHILSNIVFQKLKGTIHCDSSEGAGALFTIAFPKF